MTKAVVLNDAKAMLGEQMAGLKSDDEVLIVQNQKTGARIVPLKRGTLKFENCKGT